MNILITGPTNGIGRETALTLASEGHKLFLLCRNPSAAETLRHEILTHKNAPEPVILIANLSDIKSIHHAAETFLALDEPLDVLVNNAGVMNTSRQTIIVGGQELEEMFVVNHLGHHLLTNLLLPSLNKAASIRGKPSRIVVVASEAHALFCKGLTLDDLSRSKKFSSMRVYGESKLANIFMMKTLAKKLDPQKVIINALHPGAVNSKLGDNNKHWYAPILKLLLAIFFISPKKGAQTSLYLATQAEDTQGLYFYKSKPYRLKPWALDEAAAQQLWDYSDDVLRQELKSI